MCKCKAGFIPLASSAEIQCHGKLYTNMQAKVRFGDRSRAQTLNPSMSWAAYRPDMYTYGSTHSIFMAVCVQVQTTTCRDIQLINEIQPTRLTVHLRPTSK